MAAGGAGAGDNGDGDEDSEEEDGGLTGRAVVAVMAAMAAEVMVRNPGGGPEGRSIIKTQKPGRTRSLEKGT